MEFEVRVLFHQLCTHTEVRVLFHQLCTHTQAMKLELTRHII
jgi:hypothetical protein